MNDTRLPVETETWKELTTRFPAAVERVWRIEDQVEWSSRPGQLRQYVFDCPNGIRLIVSRETYNDDEWVHVSASVNDDTPLYRALERANPRNVVRRFLQEVQMAWMLVCTVPQWELTTEPHEWSKEKGIPHWVIWLNRSALT